MISFKIDGLDELAAALDKAAVKVPDAKKQFFANFCNNSVTVYNNVHYGIFVEKGHRVKVKGKFTGKVVKGRNMLKNAVEETKANFRQDSMAILNSIFNG